MAEDVTIPPFILDETPVPGLVRSIDTIVLGVKYRIAQRHQAATSSRRIWVSSYLNDTIAGF